MNTETKLALKFFKVTYKNGHEIVDVPSTKTIFDVAESLKRRYKHNFKMPIGIVEIELD